MSTNEEKTFANYGYYAKDLKTGSDKLVYVICDYCGLETIKKNSYLKISRKIITKDACLKCQPKKRLEIQPKSSIESIEKRKKTNLERYGNENYYKTDNFKTKSKKTCQQKYGVENAMHSEEIKQKLKQSCLDKYGVDNPTKHPDVIAKIKSHAYQHDGKTMRDWSNEIGITYGAFQERVEKYGIDIAIKMTKSISGLELKMKEFLDELKVNYSQQFRVDKQYADFFLPDYNLIIECDGLFWHSDYNIKDNGYHWKKKELYNSKGYRSLFFREDELNNQFQIVKSIILNKLGKNERKFFARKCQLKSDIDCEEFLNKHHLMGNGSGKYFSLVSGDEILAVMQVKCISGAEYEISRFCTLPSVSITGGYSRLLKFAEKDLSPTQMTNFIDARYGEGNFLPALGFSLRSKNVSFRWATKNLTVHRMKYPSNTGYEAGFAKIWDCGQIKFTKVYSTSTSIASGV